MMMNKNVENTLYQIENTVKLLSLLEIVKFYNTSECIQDINKSIARISWKNHVNGRTVSSNAFNSTAQYMSILSSGAYQVLLQDCSIVRFSFTFQQEKLLSQNLLWWPCPVKYDPEMENEYGLPESIQALLSDSDTTHLIMRTPIRIDFDSTNDSPAHPRAHLHMQHYDSRINCFEPICFNRFMQFVLKMYYPYIKLDYKHWNFLNYQYERERKKIVYINEASIAFFRRT
jgi:hypothetical protein